MADSDKDILITPNVGQTSLPEIKFSGKSNAPIYLKVSDANEVTYIGNDGSVIASYATGVVGNTGIVWAAYGSYGMPAIEIDQDSNVYITPTDASRVRIGGSSDDASLLANQAKLNIQNFDIQTYADVAPTISACELGISNVLHKEITNAHATIQFNIRSNDNGYDSTYYNRVGSISFVAESDSNRNGYFAFCTDDSGSRSEKMRITGGGNVGVGTTNPSQAFHVANGLMRTDSGMDMRNVYMTLGGNVGDVSGSDKWTMDDGMNFRKAWYLYFPHTAANRAVKLWFTNNRFWGSGEIVVTGWYSYQNASGYIHYGWQLNNNSGSTYGTSVTNIRNVGPCSNNFDVTGPTWDSTAQRHYITVRHIVSTGNQCYIMFKSWGTGVRNYLSALTGMYAEHSTY